MSDKCFRCGKEEFHDVSGISLLVIQCDRCDELVCGNCADSDYDLQDDPPRYVRTQWVCKAACSDEAVLNDIDSVLIANGSV